MLHSAFSLRKLLSIRRPDVLSLYQLYNVPRLLCMSKTINDSEVIHLLAFSSYKPTKSTRKCSLCPHMHTYTAYTEIGLSVVTLW